MESKSLRGSNLSETEMSEMLGESSNSDARNKLKPMDALNCSWLRLSKRQVQDLEQMVKAEGLDPGIHAHSDVTDYDVFTEIRAIREQENEQGVSLEDVKEEGEDDQDDADENLYRYLHNKRH